MIISNIYIYSCVNVCIYKYVIRPPQTKISGYTPARDEKLLGSQKRTAEMVPPNEMLSSIQVCKLAF